MRLIPFTLALAALVSLPACANFGKKKNAYAGSDGDYVSGTPLPDRQEGVSFMGNNVDKNRFSPVLFSFDSYSIEGGQEGKLEAVAEFLKNGGKTIIVAGFTDERGTPEYNRGLGERRAQAVREALLGRGVSTESLQTVSFGEELPADPGSGESAWARNRRAEFGIVK